MQARKYVSEALGTALLIVFGVGAATLSFGFRLDGGSVAAGVLATALSFGLVLCALAYTLGSISGAHVNPAVTLGFLLTGRIGLRDAVAYWIAQFVGGVAGAAGLWAVISGIPGWTASRIGLGADGFGRASILGVGAGGAFVVEVVLTFAFVLVVLMVTSSVGNSHTAPAAIGLALAAVHLVGIPLTGTSVNPARAVAAASFSGGHALGQVWVFILAPLVGGAGAAGVSCYLLPPTGEAASPKSH